MFATDPGAWRSLTGPVAHRLVQLQAAPSYRCAWPREERIMSGFVHWIAGPVARGAAFVLCGASAAGAAGLTGPERLGFVDSAARECMKEALGNKAVPAAITSRFCSCYAQGMADGISNAELKQLEEMDEDKASATLQTRMDAVSERCMARAKKK
jgi:hypothetical protein